MKMHSKSKHVFLRSISPQYQPMQKTMQNTPPWRRRITSINFLSILKNINSFFFTAKTSTDLQFYSGLRFFIFHKSFARRFISFRRFLQLLDDIFRGAFFHRQVHQNDEAARVQHGGGKYSKETRVGRLRNAQVEGHPRAASKSC